MEGECFYVLWTFYNFNEPAAARVDKLRDIGLYQVLRKCYSMDDMDFDAFKSYDGEVIRKKLEKIKADYPEVMVNDRSGEFYQDPMDDYVPLDPPVDVNFYKNPYYMYD